MSLNVQGGILALDLELGKEDIVYTAGADHKGQVYDCKANRIVASLTGHSKKVTGAKALDTCTVNMCKCQVGWSEKRSQQRAGEDETQSSGMSTHPSLQRALYLGSTMFQMLARSNKDFSLVWKAKRAHRQSLLNRHMSCVRPTESSSPSCSGRRPTVSLT